MWMLLALAGLIIMVMFWHHGNPEPQLSTQNNPPVSPMNEIPPPRIPQHPTITYRITRWDLLVNHLTLWMRNRVLQLILVLTLGWYVWSDLSRDFGDATILELAIHSLRILVFYSLSLVGTFVFV